MGGIYQNLLESSDGGPYVNLRDGSGTGITSTAISAIQALDVYIRGGTIGTVDEAAFTYGASQYTPIGGVYQDTSPTLTAGQGGASRLTQYRGMHVNMRTSGGVELLAQQVMASSIPVVISSDQSAVKTSNLALGTVAAGTAGTQSMLAGLVFNSSPITLTNGQQSSLQGDANGYLKTSDVNSLALNAKASPATGTGTQVNSLTSNQAALSSNVARKGYFIHNATNKAVLLAFGFTAVAGATPQFTTQLMPNGVASNETLGSFTGAINCIWPTVATSGQLQVTELT